MATRTAARRKPIRPARDPKLKTKAELEAEETGVNPNEAHEQRRREEHAKLLQERKEASRAVGEDASDDIDYEPLFTIGGHRKRVKERPHIAYLDADEKEIWYDIKLRSDLGLTDQLIVDSDMADFDLLTKKLQAERRLSDAENKELEVLLNRIFDIVFDAPKEVKDDIEPIDRFEVVRTFSYGPLAKEAVKLMAEQAALLEMQAQAEAEEAAKETQEPRTPDTSSPS